MKKIFEGKTKDLYEIDSHKIMMIFKDDVTAENGVFNPGANQVGLKMEGISKENLKLTSHFFETINKMGIHTHFLDSNLENRSMNVKKAIMFGNGIEVICRFKAAGSFVKRYGMYTKQGDSLPACVEITLKDDQRNDPLITKEALVALNILTEKEHDQVVSLCREICIYIKDECAKHDLQLFDIKLEFAKDVESKEIMLIDEISTGSMRVYKGDTLLDPFTLSHTLLND